MQIKLTCKLAETLDGIDVSQIAVGDVMELSESEAGLLIAEGWAEKVPDDGVNAVVSESDRQR